MGGNCCKPVDKSEYEFQKRLPVRTARFKEPKAMTMPTKDKLNSMAHDASIDETWRILQDPEFADVHEVVSKQVYLTSVFGMNRDDMAKKGITWVINATTEMPRFKNFKDKTLRVPVTDGRGEDIYPFLDHTADAIHELIIHGECVVIHCQAGVSRSTVLVLAYLIKYEMRSLRNAYNLILNRRHVVRPNTTFLHALVKYEGKHLPNLELKDRTRIIQVKKNNKLVEVPNWLWYDQIERFDEEFSASRQMNTAAYRDETKIFVDLDAEPAYFADHESEILGPGASMRFQSQASSGKMAGSTAPIRLSDVKTSALPIDPASGTPAPPIHSIIPVPIATIPLYAVYVTPVANHPIGSGKTPVPSPDSKSSSPATKAKEGKKAGTAKTVPKTIPAGEKIKHEAKKQGKDDKKKGKENRKKQPVPIGERGKVAEAGSKKRSHK